MSSPSPLPSRFLTPEELQARESADRVRAARQQQDRPTYAEGRTSVPERVSMATGEAGAGSPMSDQDYAGYRLRKPVTEATPEEIEVAKRQGIYTGGQFLPSREDVDMYKRGMAYTWNPETGARGYTPAYPQGPTGIGEPGRLGSRRDLTQPMRDADGRPIMKVNADGKPAGRPTAKYEKGHAISPFGGVEVYTPTKEFRQRLQAQENDSRRARLAERAGMVPGDADGMSTEDLRRLGNDAKAADKLQRQANVKTRAQIYNEARDRGVSRGEVEVGRAINEAPNDRDRGAAMINAGIHLRNPGLIEQGTALMRGAQDQEAVGAIAAGRPPGPGAQMRQDRQAIADLPVGEQLAGWRDMYRAQQQPGVPADPQAEDAFVARNGRPAASTAAAGIVMGGDDAESMDYLRDWTQSWLAGAVGVNGNPTKATYSQWLRQLGIADTQESANLWQQLTGVNPGGSRRPSAQPGAAPPPRASTPGRSRVRGGTRGK